ncbi:PEP-CTERM sorting domain-containing protein [Verrucomicrobiota bacterium]
MHRKTWLAWVLVAAVMLAPMAANAVVLNWGTSGPFLRDMMGDLLVGAFLDDNPPDYIEPFYGFDVGGFLQLVQDLGTAGPDGFDVGQANGLPAGTDDTVRDWAWVGFGAWGVAPDPLFGENDASRNGQFAAASDDVPGLQAGDTFYIRFFDTPSPDFAAGAIPTTGYYGDIVDPGWALTPGEVQAGFNVGFLVAADQQATMPVPEPGTLALFALGMLTVACRMKKK